MAETPLSVTRTFGVSGGENLISSGPVADTVLLPDGRYFSVWAFSASGNGGEIRGQFFNADGSADGGAFVVNDRNDGTQFDPHAVLLDNDKIAISWDTINRDGHDVNGRVINLDGSQSGRLEFRINSQQSGTQFDSSLAAVPGGRFVATWVTASSETSRAVVGRIFDSSGNAVTGDKALRVMPLGSDDPSIAVRADGTLIASWTATARGADSPDIETGRLDGDLNVISGSGVIMVPGAGSQTSSDIADIGNTTLVVYQNGGAIAAQTPFGLRKELGTGSFPVITAAAGGVFVAAWADGSGNIAAQVLGPAGDALGSPVVIGSPNGPLHGRLAINPGRNGHVVLTYDARQNDGEGFPVYVTDLAVNAKTAADGGSFLPGTSGNDVLIGKGGNDTLGGGEGFDYLFGGGGDDLITTIVPAGGSLGDSINGGAGNDRVVVNLLNSPVGLTLNLGGSGQQSFGSGTITSIEAINFLGSPSADAITGGAFGDSLAGFGGNDTLSGGGGNDSIDGGAGADSLAGGDGDDQLTIDSAGDVVSEASGQGSDTVFVNVALSTYTVPSNVEVVRLLQPVGTVFGNTGNNTFFGEGGANILRGGGGTDTFNGGGGDDTYVLSSGQDVVNEGLNAGNDTVQTDYGFTLSDNLEALLVTSFSGVAATGNGLGNTLTSGFGSDTLDGAGGNDLLRGFQGSDVLRGGPGDDTLDGGLGLDTASFVGATGGITLDFTAATTLQVTVGGLGTDTLIGIENVLGGDFADRITGDASPNRFDLGGGNDTAFGGGGSDTLLGGEGSDTLVGSADPFAQEGNSLNGGGGDDTLYAGRSDVVQGGSGFDVLQVRNDYDLFVDLTAQSIEYVVSQFGNDTYDAAGQAQAVQVYASGGNDTVTGSAFDDTVFAGSGNDSIVGGDGNDVIIGDLGRDTLSGGAGNDTLYIDAADDLFVDGGAGRDAAFVTGVPGGPGLSLDIAAAGLEFVADYAGNADFIRGSGATANLELYAGAGNDTVAGGSGVDIIWGQGGNDILGGGAGNDVLVGAGGADTLAGGDGIDTIYLNTGGGSDGPRDVVMLSPGSGTDIVFDFIHGEDQIDLTFYGTSYAALTITSYGPHASVYLGTTFLASVANNAGQLTAGDFIF